MTALIDNYTTVEPTRPLVAKEWHKTATEITYSSIIVNIHQQLGLNKRIHKLLDEYSKLQNNWDEDDAIAPDAKAIQMAQFITHLLEKHGQPIFHAAPGPNGEIMLDIRNNKKTRSIEIIFYSNRSVSVIFPEEGKPTQQKFEVYQLPELLEWLNKK